MQPNHHDVRQVFQDGSEKLSQVKFWAPAPPQPLLQPENSARKEASGRRSKRTIFSASSRLSLSFWRAFGKPAGTASLAKQMRSCLTICTAVASYAGAPSCVCDACAWRFLLSFVF